MDYESKFREWLETNSVHRYSGSTIAIYIRALRNAGDWFGVTLAKPLLEIGEADEIRMILQEIAAVPEYDTINLKHGHGSFSAAIAAYQVFLDSMREYAWIPFYMEFADKLLEYRLDRNALIEKLIDTFETIGIKFPKMESDVFPVDVDPFTVFGLFNKHITDTNRCAIIKELADELGVKAPQPKTFQGIPVLNNLRATFFSMLPNRGEKDIDNLWDVFISAIRLANEETKLNRDAFVAAFDTVRAQKGIRWNITMGLYWIRPYYYINLDSRNRWFISNEKNTTKEYTDMLPVLDKVPSGAEYFKICDASRKLVKLAQLPYSTIPELSYCAWNISNEEDHQDEAESQIVSANDSLADGDVKKTRYWLYSPGEQAYKWDQFYAAGIMGIGWDLIGDVSAFATKEEIKQTLKVKMNPNKSYQMDALALWQFANEVQQGDIIFVKRGRDTVIGRGIVVGDYQFSENADDEYKHIRKVKWTHKGEWLHPGKAVLKTLTDVTQYTDYVEKLCALFEDGTKDAMEEPEKKYPHYTEADFLRDVYMSANDYHMLVDALMKKKNIILQGAPGVGKTYAAKRLAYSIMGEKNQERVMMIQFHQSYSYEDFIEGYRPTAEGFNIRKGVFYKFCKKASEDDENDYFFIIDEINRGNLSKIFGELFMLIETDKRGVELLLLYSDEKFSVPPNVHIIGMMNTADRSLAMLDYALRRRFSFVDMKPGFDTEGFVQYRDSLQNDKFNALIRCVQQLNVQIKDDVALGEGFSIGHSYFCNLMPETITDKDLYSIVEFELIPLLHEYWFDEKDKVAEWSARLRGAVK